ncbi:hypothetical protein [Microlunatus sp. Gsoil 973]|uniref:hypothetical protein n=1 Tax=Microlunatus sp. Gsoil 973 TaxID=2672569 RepID=UPI0012B4B885|nr:hypothetical protein [Microlunatus sp. Gsoil 973]QGN33610.1 hypothetical protein GJV80_13230 [Microlunatus sp. Gsoil 973]
MFTVALYSIASVVGAFASGPLFLMIGEHRAAGCATAGRAIEEISPLPSTV